MTLTLDAKLFIELFVACWLINIWFWIGYVVWTRRKRV